MIVVESGTCNATRTCFHRLEEGDFFENDNSRKLTVEFFKFYQNECPNLSVAGEYAFMDKTLPYRNLEPYDTTISIDRPHWIGVEFFFFFQKCDFSYLHSPLYYEVYIKMTSTFSVFSFIIRSFLFPGFLFNDKRRHRYSHSY